MAETGRTAPVGRIFCRMKRREENRFAGKNYLVVGASSGIGRATAHRLLDEEATVYAWSRRDDPDLAERGAVQVPRDITKSIDAATIDLPGELHGLVYAPGTISLAPFKRLTPELFQSDLEVNLLGAVRVLQAVLDRLLAAGAAGDASNGASVVLFSTVAVARGMAFHASVAAAKGAVEGFARSMAAEYAPRRLRFNVIAPSLTDTPLAANLLGSEKKAEAAAERHPLKRTGVPGDMAGAALFLLDPENSWITGQVLGVDGGLGSLA